MLEYNKQLSEKITHKYSSLIQEHHCYENAYNMVTEDIDELKLPSKLSILFCYWRGEDNRYYRHAFCLYDGKIVEPLLYDKMDEEYLSTIIPIRYMTVPEYLEMVEQDGTYGLQDVLYQDELRVVAENGIFQRLGLVDLSNLYREAEPEPDMNELNEDMEA